ncbi:MAG: metal ABC transporter permease [Alistipes sp.]
MDFIGDILQYNYLRNAIIACLLSGIICGIIGTYTVARRTVFLSGGITHASFGGLGIAFYAGINPILGAMVFAVASALGIEYVSSRGRIREDSAIGLIWGVGMAVGAMFMSLRPGYTSGDLSSFLFGNIITVTDTDVIALAVTTAVLLIMTALWLRPIMYVAFDRNFAQAAGIHTKIVSYAMSVITAITIVLSIRVMGIVLLISLFTMPVVCVNFFSKSYKTITLWSAVVAIAAGFIGIILSYYVEIPSGPAIIFVLTFALIVAKPLSLHMVKSARR